MYEQRCSYFSFTVLQVERQNFATKLRAVSAPTPLEHSTCVLINVFDSCSLIALLLFDVSLCCSLLLLSTKTFEHSLN
jgi:hypothetical protein